MERIHLSGGGDFVSEILIGPSIIEPRNVVARSHSGVALLAQPSTLNRAQALAAELAAAGYRVATFELPDREAAKTLAVAERIYLWLNSLGMTRSDCLVAIGGGAATDIGGFVGATYLRGLETILIPTTLLGAVDAAIGGKTAVNVGGKNLAGVFMHPARIVIDTDTLAALPRSLLIEGTAEAVKAGFINDGALLDLYRKHGLDAPLPEVVSRAVRVKVSVVEQDFTEADLRAILNYGHTIGHAVEHVAGIPHGHAVAIGMVAAGAASTAVTGFTRADEQRHLLEKLELPTQAPPVDAAAVEAALLLDKKRDTSGLRMVLLEDFGKPIVATVDMTTVRAALSAVGIG